MTWIAVWSDTAKRQLKKFPKKDQKRILDKTDEVEQDPFRYLIRLSGEPFHRFRMGNYRIIVNVVNDHLLLQIVKVKNRKNAYKK
ncbi:MAG: type II toxin-antitoxin system RelE/ParE family toxin [Nitrosopumilus sp.]